MRNASDLVLAHGNGRIISTGKNRSRYRGRIWRGRSRVDKELRKLMSQELDEIFDKAHLDREKAEVVSLTESRLLDVDRGEVLRNSRYIRIFNF